MKKNTMLYVLPCILSFLIPCSMFAIPIQAAANPISKISNNTFALPANSMNYLSQDTDITLKYKEESDENEITIVTGSGADTDTPVFYWSKEIQTNRYGELDIAVKNKDINPLRLHVDLTSYAYGKLDMAADRYVVLESDNGEVSYVQTDEYGFELPAWFEGTVKIPFYLLKTADTDKMMQTNLGIISYIGVTVVCGEDEEKHVSFSGGALVPNEDAIPYVTVVDWEIIGEDVLTRPSMGKVFSDYIVKSYNMFGEAMIVDADFQLKYQVNGITMKKNGKIIVSAEANADTIILLAKVEGNETLQKQVQLENSWTASTKTENGYDASIPDYAEVAKVSLNSGFFYSKITIYVIWTFGLAAVTVFCMFYLPRRHFWKK